MAYYPNSAEVALLFASSYGLFAIAIWLFRRVTATRAIVPVWIAALVAMIAFTCFLGVTVSLWKAADREWISALADYDIAVRDAAAAGADLPPRPASRTLMLMLYAAAFWFIPAVYYARQLVSAFSARTIQELSAVEQTEDEIGSPFKIARDMALRGDIDGAVARYRAYVERAKEARFEAAQLLESEGRYRDALDLYIEISDRFRDDIRAWGEAIFRRAKLLEGIFDDVDGARLLYKRILDRAPETEFATLASTQLGRLQQGPGALLKALDAGFQYEGNGAEPVVSHISPAHQNLRMI